MAVDASATRAKLIAAGEQLFAERGIEGAQMRDIVRAAGQANDSAVHYHFGSRDGLLSAICQAHIDEMEPERARRLAAQPADPRLDHVLADLVQPTAARLHTRSGRHFLQITAQLAGRAGVRDGAQPPAVVGPALRRQLEQIQLLCEQAMPAELARERVAFMIGSLTAALAERARALQSHQRLAIDEQTFVANLEAMLVASLSAPLPQSAPVPPSAPLPPSAPRAGYTSEVAG